MDDLLNLGPWVNLGGWLFIVAMVIVSWVRGLLYPARQVTELINVYERLLEDKREQINTWKEAYKNSDARGDVLAKNQEDLLVSMKTMSSLIQTLVTAGSPNSRENIR
jgi:hypothetical protein